MKIYLHLQLVVCVLTVGCAKIQGGQALTNGISLDGTGMRLSISDDESASIEGMSKDVEVRANSTLRWVLQNTSTNKFSSVVFLGMSNSFSLELKTTNNVPVSKTAKGIVMSKGPKSLTNFHGNDFVRRIGPGVMDLPAVSELFEISYPGTYVLEVRYWNWSATNRAFQLSDPVRIKVASSASTETKP